LTDQKSRAKAATITLSSEVDSFKQQFDSQVEQEKIVRGKLADLQKNEQPFVAEARTVASEAAALKQQLAEASFKEDALVDQLTNIQAKRASLENDKTVARYKSLLDDKKSLESRMADVQDQIQDLTKAKTEAPRVEDLKRKIESFEKQNKAMGSEIDNLREDIAVLDYKISSLERYQGRNHQRGR
jgi:chromosome segregation ATPase